MTRKIRKACSMGLRRSIQKRWILAKDFPLKRRPEIFFAPKAYRNELWNQRTLSRRAAHRNKDFKNPKTEAHALNHINEIWYAEIHGLKDPKEASIHFLEHGLPLGYAPSPDFSDPTGKLLDWGCEYFARLGLPIGQKSTEYLIPGDPIGIKPFSIKNEEKKPLAVVTANFGSYDRLLPVNSEWEKSADFFLVSDRKFDNPGVWQHTHANYYHPDPRRRARFVKTHLPTYFGAYERVMWVDGNILLCRDPVEILKDYDVWKHDFVTFRHWQRTSLLQEAVACAQLGKENPANLGAHLGSVSSHPAFGKRNVFATMVMMVNPKSEEVQKMTSAWWRYIMNGSKRDQLSLPLAVDDVPKLDWNVFPEQSIELSSNFVRPKH